MTITMILLYNSLWQYNYNDVIIDTLRIQHGDGYNIIIGCAKVVSVSISCSRYSVLMDSFLFSHVLWFTCFIGYSLKPQRLLVYIA